MSDFKKALAHLESLPEGSKVSVIEILSASTGKARGFLATVKGPGIFQEEEKGRWYVLSGALHLEGSFFHYFVREDS